MDVYSQTQQFVLLAATESLVQLCLILFCLGMLV